MIYNYCKWCTNKKLGFDCDSFASLCPILTEVWDLIEAAEFEARVSARLACTVENLQNLFPPNEMIVIPKETILRDVRIAVEAEMDKQ